MNWTSTTAAALATHYPEFRRTSPPSGAQRAWTGILRPLSQNHELVPILADLERNEQLRVLPGGALHHDPACNRDHQPPWYANRLAGARRAFTILLADLGQDRHPRVFCIKPAISTNILPTHPHLRPDQAVWYNGTFLHALCTYLASDGANPPDDLTLVRALDYTSIFLAKHLIWTNTATLSACRQGMPPRIITTDHSGIGLYFRPTITANTEYRWDGYWPGQAAPHTPAELLATINPLSECPCGKRTSYANCCRNDHRDATPPPISQRLGTARQAQGITLR